MFERFAHDARAIVAAAADEEAPRLGSRTVEAEHLLLALAARGVAGLDHATVEEALDAEQRASLAAVGVDVDVFDLPARRPTLLTPRFGTSAKAALEGTLKAALARGDRQLHAGHLLLGVLAPDRGTVPRALELAGLDREALREAAEHELG
jgi:ATP-dependent Clp protease ATP-binding subunit ClpA